MSNRIYNFGAGPAMLPEAILLEAQQELLNWHDTGMSIMEVGHRSASFEDVMQHAEQSLRSLLKVPSNYHILFLGCAARQQFSMIPMNFIQGKQKGGYLITGIWSEMAYEEACLLRTAYCAASTESTRFTSLPSQSNIKIEDDSAYLCYTPNETVNGVQFSYVPECGEVPLIADMTSCLLTEPIDVSQFAMIFAGAQKNIANAGLSIAIISDEFLKRQQKQHPIPTMLNYKIQADNQSLFATPPGFNIYLAGKMFDWVKQQGGVETLYEQNKLKAKTLYQYIESSDFYETRVQPNARSIVNICFHIKDAELEDLFVKMASKHGISGVKGHRKIGGLRASLYNPMPIEGVEALVQFMKQFAEEHSR